MSSRDIVQAAAGTAGEVLYVDDVFSTYLYTGTGSTLAINNGINLGPVVGNSTFFNAGQINTNTSSSGFDLGTSDWTIECWLKTSYTSRIDPFELNGGTDATIGFFGLTLNRTNNGDIEWNEATGSSATVRIQATGTSITDSAFHHIAISRSGNSVKMFLDGTQIGTTYTTSYTYGGASKAFRFGNRYPGGISSSAVFYISNFRIVKGTALYTSTFTPPTSILTTTSGTTYLAHQSNSSTTDTTSLGNSYVNLATATILGPTFGAGEGGLVWIKATSSGVAHALFDTEVAALDPTYYPFLLTTSTADKRRANKNGPMFFSNGFAVGLTADVSENSYFFGNTTKYVSWTFRKAPKFFDVVTYTGDGVAGRTINHNLEVAPGMVIVKEVNATGNWVVYHRAAGGNLFLNLTSKELDDNRWMGDGTATTIRVGNTNYGVTDVNESGISYVAYFFAHDTDADGFIQCGSYSNTSTITLGWEPQFVMVRRCGINTGGEWIMADMMRGMAASGGVTNMLSANSTASESAGGYYISPTPTGFTVNTSDSNTGSGSSFDKYIYLAIRRPRKPPTAGTGVFAPQVYSSGSSPAFSGLSFSPDAVIQLYKPGSGATEGPVFGSKLLGAVKLQLSNSAADTSDPDFIFYQNGFRAGSATTNYAAELFRRAPGFFDVVCYAGTNSAGVTVSHNLEVIPELIITRVRNYTGEDWIVHFYNAGTITAGYFNNTASFANSVTAPSTDLNNFTSTTYNRNTSSRRVNGLYNYVAFLFATLPGISKVGTYTGNGTNQTINCGFSAGARFILIKRTDSTGDWYVWDSARGIVAGNDPHLSLNTTVAEVTTDDSVDPDSSGFIVNQLAATNINVNTATYVYLAIA